MYFCCVKLVSETENAEDTTIVHIIHLGIYATHCATVAIKPVFIHITIELVNY